jgi:hypothetical protein
MRNSFLLVAINSRQLTNVIVVSSASSKERFVSEVRLLHEAFARIVEERTREAKDSALAAMASLKAPESKAKNRDAPPCVRQV